MTVPARMREPLPRRFQGILIGADYTILLFAEAEEIAVTLLQERITAFLAQSVVWRERERKGERYTYNLRPLILELRHLGYDPASEEHRIFLRVQMRDGATGRPDEVVDALGFGDFARTLRRDKLYFSDVASDAATFAAYPLITQEQISGPRPAQPPAKGRHGQRDQRPPVASTLPGRTISERAGDEFA